MKKGSQQLSPKQLLDKLYNGGFDSKNWHLTKGSKKTLTGALLIIVTGAIAANMIEKNNR